MALVLAKLQADLLTFFTADPGPATREAAASSLTDVYDAYSLAAQHCGGLTVTLVNKAGLLSALTTVMQKNPSDYATPANELADAFTQYWTGAKFGATGTVVDCTTGKVALVAVFAGMAPPNAMPASREAAAQLWAAGLDAYTRSVTAMDTVLPGGVGSGPLPIF